MARNHKQTWMGPPSRRPVLPDAPPWALPPGAERGQPKGFFVRNGKLMFRNDQGNIAVVTGEDNLARYRAGDLRLVGPRPVGRPINRPRPGVPIDMGSLIPIRGIGRPRPGEISIRPNDQGIWY